MGTSAQARRRRSTPYTRDERLPYVDFLIARGRALATLGEDPRNGAAQTEIERLKREAERLDWPTPLAGLTARHSLDRLVRVVTSRRIGVTRL